MLDLMDGAGEVPRAGEVRDSPSGPPYFRRSAKSYRQQEPPRTTVDCSSSVVEALNTCDGSVEQTKPKSNANPESLAMAPKPRLVESPTPHAELSDQLSQGDQRSFPNSQNSSGDRSQLRPPVADVSPPLSARTPERKERWRRWSEEDGETTENLGKGEVVAVDTSNRGEGAILAREQDDNARAQPVEQVPGRTDPDEAMISDNPLHR